MKLTKLIIASLLATESTHFAANAKAVNPFAKKANQFNLTPIEYLLSTKFIMIYVKKADVMKLVGEI